MRRLGYLAGRKRWWERLWGRARANLLSFEALYHQLSAYGDSWWKPLAWLVAFVFLLFPFVYTLFGIDLGSGQYAFGDGTFAPGPLLEFSLRTAALLPTDGGTNVAGVALLLQVIERVWSPFLAVLFTLAVRRRFRR